MRIHVLRAVTGHVPGGQDRAVHPWSCSCEVAPVLQGQAAGCLRERNQNGTEAGLGGALVLLVILKKQMKSDYTAFIYCSAVPSDSLLVVLSCISNEITLSCEQLLPFLRPVDLPVATPAKQRQCEAAHQAYTSAAVQLHLPKLQRGGLPVPLGANSHQREQPPEPTDPPAFS